MEVSRAADVAVLYRRPILGRFWPMAMQVVPEDRFHRGVGARSDQEGLLAGSLVTSRVVV